MFKTQEEGYKFICNVTTKNIDSTLGVNKSEVPIKIR